ncbi:MULTISPECIES: IS200/IS605 family transposase [Thermoanaerobacterium]|uniref:Transposase IS200-family protein n=2 Tax=Thermoanaerobacterium TaxID=28895 RepID=W9EG90_9THEO|nr:MULTISPECIES: IS200/IS605 family transposase [Thermoanaerobacterium]AFK85916.1 transposase IS200-family protein [Thermoanaerobacterium saccharolyticum JW/SL-YS485]ETO38744.1 transposase IS200-family protein [Thermoanaerobacterium aotearoense SCUT27]
MNTQYKTTRHAKFLINYHFIWIPKYRRKILDNPEIVDLIKNTIAELSEKYNYEILAMEIMPDHIHLQISAIPQYSPADLMNKIKGITGFRIAKQFPELKARGKIWTNSYFCATTGNVSTDMIKKYIEEQWSKIK